MAISPSANIPQLADQITSGSYPTESLGSNERTYVGATSRSGQSRPCGYAQWDPVLPITGIKRTWHFVATGHFQARQTKRPLR